VLDTTGVDDRGLMGHDEDLVLMYAGVEEKGHSGHFKIKNGA